MYAFGATLAVVLVVKIIYTTFSLDLYSFILCEQFVNISF